MNKIYTLILLFLYCATTPCHGQQVNKKRELLTSGIDSIIQKQVDMDKIPGAVILVMEGDDTIMFSAYGFATRYDYDNKQLSTPEMMTTGHLFDLASLTKAVGTTTSVMLLADRGMLNVDDPVCRYIKAFDTPEKKDITIRHLLTHTAGLTEWYPLYYLASDKQQCYSVIAELPLKYPVGEQRHYSDLGFIILGQIIETVSGTPLDRFMNDNIFKPLGMNDTGFNPLNDGKHKMIASTSAGNPYEKRMVSDPSLGFTTDRINPQQWNGWRTYLLHGEVNDGNTWYANGGISGAAGLFSTAGDISRITGMLLNKGMTANGCFVSQATVESFLTPDRFNNGLGWMMDPANSFMKNAPAGTFGHTGFTGTSITVIPGHKITIILLINRQNTGLHNGEYYNVNPIRLQVFNAVADYLLLNR